MSHNKSIKFLHLIIFFFFILTKLKIILKQNTEYKYKINAIAV